MPITHRTALLANFSPQIFLSGMSLINMTAQNAGNVIGAITTNFAQTTPIVIGGPNAALFSVTNGGFVPCNLIAAVNIPSGDYPISLSAT